MPKLPWIFVAVLGLSALPQTVRALEDQVTLGVELGWAGVPNSSTLPKNGMGAGLTGAFGITDAWAVRGLGNVNILFGDRRLRTGIFGVEAIYLLDVVRFVPVFGFGVDGMVSGFSGRTRAELAMHALLGIDFLINPRWLIGVDGRGYWVTTNRASFLDPLFFTVAARLGFRFDTD